MSVLSVTVYPLLDKFSMFGKNWDKLYIGFNSALLMYKPELISTDSLAGRTQPRLHPSDAPV